MGKRTQTVKRTNSRDYSFREKTNRARDNRMACHGGAGILENPQKDRMSRTLGLTQR